jgi:hypothetical protein
MEWEENEKKYEIRRCLEIMVFITKINWKFKYNIKTRIYGHSPPSKQTSFSIATLYSVIKIESETLINRLFYELSRNQCHLYSSFRFLGGSFVLGVAGDYFHDLADILET